MRLIHLFTSFIFTFLIVSCSVESKYNFVLQSGDILFVAKPTESADNLDSAIDAVTQTDSATNFTHMGIVDLDLGHKFVIHADPKIGVCRESLSDFMLRNKSVTVFRINNDYQYFIPAAIKKAKQLIGSPYDSAYIMGKGSYCCSGLIYSLFEDCHLFSLDSMTFIDPSTGDFHPVWVQYYKNLGISIPEGQPGCNPNGMAASKKLIRLGVLSVSNK